MAQGGRWVGGRWTTTCRIWTCYGHRGRGKTIVGLHPRPPCHASHPERRAMNRISRRRFIATAATAAAASAAFGAAAVRQGRRPNRRLHNHWSTTHRDLRCGRLPPHQDAVARSAVSAGHQVRTVLQPQSTLLAGPERLPDWKDIERGRRVAQRPADSLTHPEHRPLARRAGGVRGSVGRRTTCASCWSSGSGGWTPIRSVPIAAIGGTSLRLIERKAP